MNKDVTHGKEQSYKCMAWLIIPSNMKNFIKIMECPVFVRLKKKTIYLSNFNFGKNNNGVSSQIQQ